MDCKNKVPHGYSDLLFEIFGLTGWDKYSKEKPILFRNSARKKHWWVGMKKKPKFYKSYRNKVV